MSDEDKDLGEDSNVTPFRFPDEDEGSETFRQRLRRKRMEVGEVDGSALDREATGWRASDRHLVMMLLTSPHASATIAKKDASAARRVEGVEAVLLAEDIPGENELGPGFPGEPLLADQEVCYVGQPLAIIIGEDEASCRAAREEIQIDYHELPGILNLEHAAAMKSYHSEARKTERGDVRAAIAKSDNRYQGELTIASQRPCLEIQPSITIRPMNRGETIRVQAKSLLPSRIRSAVARVSGLPESAVEVESEAANGLPGALESEPVRLAILATYAALKGRAAVTLILDSPTEPLIAGDRHATHGKYTVGFSDDGVIEAANIDLRFDAGFFPGDSQAFLDRALLHCDSVYGIPDLRIRGILCKTNRLTSGSMPGEGAAQGAWVMEELIQRVAGITGIPADEIREKNFYGDDTGVNTTPYGQPVNPSAIQRVWNHAIGRSEYYDRVKEVEKWNRRNPSHKRGIAATPVKFGLGDPRPERNMGMALIHILPDGSVQVRPGLIDLRDGLDLQLKEEISNRFGISPANVRVIPGDLNAVPQATPANAVDSAGLILRAMADASEQLLKQLRETAVQLFAAKGHTEVDIETIVFTEGKVGPESFPGAPLEFNEVVAAAWRRRVNLLAVGYHRTPNLWWDPELGAGWPFSSFTYAAVVTEIQVDAFTGEIQILRVDVAHEGSPTPDQSARDEAQLFRSFSVGAGWILSEDLAEDNAEEGMPGFADAPLQWESDRLRPSGDFSTAAGDPCGEAPVLLAGSIREALWNALRAFGLNPALNIDLPLPATPSAVLATCTEISKQLAQKEKEKQEAKAEAEESVGKAG